MTVLDQLLEKVTRYDYNICDPGCDCCGVSVEFQVEQRYGEYIKYDELVALIAELKAQAV
jgi:hypothetical protein